MLDMVRLPEEKELFDNLARWIAMDTVMELMADASIGTPVAHDVCTLISPAIPNIHDLITEVCGRTGVNKSSIKFFIAPSYSLWSRCVSDIFNTGAQSHIILSTTLVSMLNTDELRAVIAHELAHIHFGHADLIKCMDWLNIEAKQGRLFALANIYHYWRQLAEISADRAALLAADAPNSAISCLARQNLRSIADDIDIKSLINEQTARINRGQILYDHDNTHPPWEFRIVALKLFSESSLLRSLKQNNPSLKDDSIGAVMALAERLKVSPRDEYQFLEFMFLLAAGNYLIRADGSIHRAEVERLHAILARLIHAPDKELMQMDDISKCIDIMHEIGSQILQSCPARALDIFELLCTLVVQDGILAPDEKRALEKITLALGIRPQEAASALLRVLRNEFHPQI